MRPGHHRRQQEEEQRKREAEEEERRRAQEEALQQQQAAFQPAMGFIPPYTGGPRPRGPIRPMGPGVRHQPYPTSRPQRFIGSPSHPGLSNTVKSEPQDESSNQSNDAQSENSFQGQDGDNAANVSVKLEDLNDSDIDELEITGVEPGQPVPQSQQGWDPNVSMAMGYDSSGATGSQADMAGQQGYSKCLVLPCTTFTIFDIIVVNMKLSAEYLTVLQLMLAKPGR